ncbi:hypothetical protein Tco_0837608, partial [Tanacetum coccineum]
FVTDQNKCKTFSEVDSDTNPPIVSSLCLFQALMEDSKEELKEFSDEEILDATDNMDVDTHKSPTPESPKPKASTKPSPKSDQSKNPDEAPKPINSDSYSSA